MKITFYSNFFNHHQEPISLEFVKKGIEYTFVATEPVPEERLRLGYEDMNKKYDFILTTYDSEENYNKALELAKTSDIVIIGSAKEEFVQERIKENKIIFRYSERIFKQGRIKLKNLKTILYGMLKLRKLNKSNTYMLCASAYCAKDYKILGAYNNKCYRWGYFPEFTQYDIESLLAKKENGKVKIIWVARYISWKHPEYAIDLASELVKRGYTNFEVIMLGNGEMLENITKRVREQKLEDYVRIVGSVPSTKVREYMEEASIHIFTSDEGEGWGAVLNESMNSACAVVANKKIGAVPYLIQNEKNGLWYNNKNEFINNVIRLIDDSKLRRSISIEAYNTIDKLWNAETAVNNLLKLYENILSKKTACVIESGPCSKDVDYL